MISLSSLIERAARLNPKGTATVFDGRRRQWSETRDRVSRLASGLRQLGLAAGDRIAILSLNSDRYYESIFSILWAGYALVPLNTRWALAENNYALSDSGATVLLYDAAFAEQAKALLAQVDSIETIVYMGEDEDAAEALSYEKMIAGNEPVDNSPRCGDDMAGIFYTGGTTGFPKGVMLSHGAIWSSAMSAIQDFDMQVASVYLHTAPMFHIADFTGTMVTTLAMGANIVVQRFDPKGVLDTIKAQRVSHTIMVPAMIKGVLAHPDSTSADVSSLRYIIYGASPMPEAVLTQLMSQWPLVGLVQVYGQTELAPIVTMLSKQDHLSGGNKLTSAGRPSTVSDVKVVDESGEDCPLGVSGEILARGPHNMQGYWNKPEQTADAVKDGWIYTGDAGYFDEEGYLYIVDRVKDMVVTGGENVFTTEVENAVISHSAVRDVAVIGIPHDEWGEAVHAIVVLQEGETVSEQELIDHCRDRIAGYKVPKSVSFREEPLPLSGAGKILKTELRKPWWENRDRKVN